MGCDFMTANSGLLEHLLSPIDFAFQRKLFESGHFLQRAEGGGHSAAGGVSFPQPHRGDRGVPGSTARCLYPHPLRDHRLSHHQMRCNVQLEDKSGLF